MKHIVRIGASLAVALTVLGATSPVHAHDDNGIFTVESADTSQPATVGLVVRLVYSQDREPANEATVTATAVSPSGEQQTPVPLALADQDGRYTGALTTPAGGAWTVRIASLDPIATLEVPVAVAAPTTTTVATTSTTTATTATTDLVPAEPASESSSSAPLLIAVLAAAFAIGLGGYFLNRRLRHNRSST